MAQKRILSPEQDVAANPSENVWVQANAGTGKTSVLVQRLLRILFRGDDVGTNGILCLTYTNAGAGEMRNRILAALRGWAVASDDELREMLCGVALNKNPTDDDIAHARKIFFTYIDNPEILKIKTIHGFCEEILRRFPLEAGISPSWTLVSDTAQRVLLQDAFNRLVKTSNDTRVADAFAHIVGRVSETYMSDLLDILSDQYKHFFGVENIVKYREYFIDTIKYFLNLNSVPTADFDVSALKNIVQTAQDDINCAKKPAKYMLDVVNLTRQYIDKTIDFDEYKSAYLKSDGGRIANIAKKPYLVDEQERVYALNQYHENQMVFDDTMALFDLSAAFAMNYRDIKSQHNALDFEDLILYTRRLFSQPESMGWVLSQLNISLSHILVDEAQDTSPAQWDIMRMLAGDFFTDGDTATRPHSLFVVGDTKQSIYGFQGADPRAFATSRDEIVTQIAQNLRTLREVPLAQSFRSLPAILNTVDRFFGDSTVIEMTGFANNAHKCFRTSPSGLVELHKLVSKQDDETTVGNYICMIADQIKSLLETGRYAPHDIMVLVQNRNPMASPLVTELKRRGIDVAGSDRIVLPDFPAVRDLLNLVRFCLDTTDDYSLCCVLRSPIFRLTERDIFNICKIKNDENRVKKSAQSDVAPTTVFDILRDTNPDIYNQLNTFVEWSRTMSPYSFFTHVLSGGVRESIIAALGDQVIDPLEEFMTICLAYERTMPGTLRHFLKWFITGSSEVKRDMDAAAGVRIATVHGSKGLEARVIFLIDTVRVPKSERIVPILRDTLPPALRARGANMPDVWLWAARGDNSAARASVADMASNVRIAEYYRLLYVAMTRARDELYIYGFTPHKNAPDIAWHTQLWRVLANGTDKDVIRIEQ